MREISKECQHCGGQFSTKLPNQIYCCKACRVAAANERIRYGNSQSVWVAGIAPATIGAGHELLASLDLMNKGYDIFRALSPACDCDIIAINKHSREVLRIEARTCLKNKAGEINFNKARREWPTHKYDIYAAVTHTGEVTYYDMRIREIVDMAIQEDTDGL